LNILELSGTHYEMGYAHGCLVRDRLSPLIEVMNTRLDALGARGVDYEPRIREVLDVWTDWADSTLDMLHGIADGLQLDWEPFVQYTLRSYLEDSLLTESLTPSPLPLEEGQEVMDGCTAWAAAGPATRDGRPLLVKNRDFRPAHLDLQLLMRATPKHGYRYAYVTSAGSPGVYSSGMNAAGLAVADTHVASPDAGPGVARYSLMMDMLEQHDNVASALDYLRQVPRMGHGTLILADAAGNLAVAELGYHALGIVEPGDGTVVTTNHFVSPPLAQCWVDTSRANSRGNSLTRRATVERALAEATGQIDVAFAEALMARHGGPLGSLCRHVEMDGRSATISTVIFEPALRRLHFCHGAPCSAPYAVYLL
jgi:isopenicillin-N N-acyltransferase-like protein